MIEIIIGVIVGAVITWFVSKVIQDRQFEREDEIKNNLLKTQVVLLQADLHKSYDLLLERKGQSTERGQGRENR